MKFERTDVWGFEHAIRGMRNPLESWSKSDSGNLCLELDWNRKVTETKICDNCGSPNCEKGSFCVGKNDLNLMQRLIKAGGEHRKFLRQIFVSVDITASGYFFSQFDTYKVGTVANSTSKMHKLADTIVDIDCFEMDDYNGDLLVYDNEPYQECFTVDDIWEEIINHCETLRRRYLETKDKRYWKELVRLLPESWLQTRTVTMNYENILNMCSQRKGHRLTEWQQFIDWAYTLPYAKELIFFDEQGDIL